MYVLGKVDIKITWNAFITIVICAACQTGSVKSVTCLIDAVWTAQILTIFSVRFVTCYQITQLINIIRMYRFFQKSKRFIYHIIKCRIRLHVFNVEVEVQLFILGKYQYYSQVPSNQHNNYICRQQVYMSCSLGSKHKNSFAHNNRSYKL